MSRLPTPKALEFRESTSKPDWLKRIVRTHEETYFAPIFNNSSTIISALTVPPSLASEIGVEL